VARKMTLRERANNYAHNTVKYGDGLLGTARGSYLAGWHARGRSDRLTKAQVDKVWVVQNKTTAAVFSSKEAADAWVSSHPGSVAGGMYVSETPLFHLERAKGRK